MPSLRTGGWYRAGLWFWRGDEKMEQKLPNVIRSKSQITYSYATIKITQSRIDKGLIAIPKSLAGWFPDHNDTIQIYLNDSPVSQSKHYSSYSSSTRECRIGGVRGWFQQNNIKSGDEIVIQFIDRGHLIYRLIPERNFILKTKELQYGFDNAKTEKEASGKITTLAQWTHLNKNRVVFNEYFRLINTLPKNRQYIEKKSLSQARENAPANIRTLLGDIYKGCCQVCDFWFLKKDKEPYFEIHHLDPLKGHHLPNLLVVCGNCHNQFEHADVKQHLSDDGWLVGVSFNESKHSVKQAALTMKIEGFFKELFI
jgi:hypothetical protein